SSGSPSRRATTARLASRPTGATSSSPRVGPASRPSATSSWLVGASPTEPDPPRERALRRGRAGETGAGLSGGVDRSLVGRFSMAWLAGALVLSLAVCKNRDDPPSTASTTGQGEGGCPGGPPEALFTVTVRTADAEPLPSDT